jgi:DNA-binding transcriptional MerR regulator
MAGWTLDELVARVAEALAVDGVRSSSGRVRDVPDARALRWYATIGLLDRPIEYRGRCALYGPRHLLQAVAVKRRQAEGMTLAQIQTELAGAADPMLHQVARVPAELLADRPVSPPPNVPQAPDVPEVSSLHLVRLAPGATLALAAAPTTVDVADLRAAAAPLIRLLTDRRLLAAEELNP